MQPPSERLGAIAAAARERLAGRIRSAVLLAVLLAALIWFTKWPGLRAGLWILFLAQCIVAGVLVARTRTLAVQSQAMRKNVSGPAPADWFEAQARFVRALAIFENAARAAGFVVLGWGFWSATRNLAIAMALGIAYPLLAYFAMERPRQSRILKDLRSERDAFDLHSWGAGQNE